MTFYEPKFDFVIRSINTLYKRQLALGETFKGEQHDFWELVFIQSGKLTVAEDERVYEMHSGQIIFHKPMEFHRFWSPRAESTNVIIISFSCCDGLIQPLGDGVFDLDTILKQELIDIADAINNHFYVTSLQVNKKQNNDPTQEMLTILKLHTFLLHTIEHAVNRQEQSFNASAINYRKIICAMNEHVYENLSVKDIADLCCLGVSNLKKTFNLYAGCGVMHYFNNLKVMKAKELLKEGFSVAEVSEKLSFSSPNYFSLVFKKYSGKLPTHFRYNI